jgi:hypothetical protein
VSRKGLGDCRLVRSNPEQIWNLAALLDEGVERRAEAAIGLLAIDSRKARFLMHVSSGYEERGRSR